MTAPTAEQLLAHNDRVRRMLADPECVGELLLVGIGMARCGDDTAAPPGRAALVVHNGGWR